MSIEGDHQHLPLADEVSHSKWCGASTRNQDEARRCYNQAVRNASRPRQVNIINQRPPSEGPLDDTIDLRSLDEEATTGPIEDLVDLSVDDNESSKVLKLGKNLSDEL